MREYLLEIALRKAGYIMDKVKETGLEEVLEKAAKLWVKHEPQGVEPSSFGAVDGSNNSLEFKGLTLYAVLGYGITRESSVKEYFVGDIDVLYTGDTSEHVRLLREIAEMKTAYLASNVDLLMIDGSITSLLIRPRPLTDNVALSTAIREALEIDPDIFDTLWSDLKKQLSSCGNILVDPYISRRLSHEHKLYSERKFYLPVLLEYIEKLLTIRLLLDKMVARKKKPGLVFISKTSRSRHYFREEEAKRPIPSDILIFTYATREPGYSNPLIPEFEKGLPREGPLKSMVHDFFEEFEYVVSYIRFEADAPLLKFEIPVYKGMYSGGDDLKEIIVHLIESIYPLTVDGYPYPLIEADKSSKITRDDLINIAQIIGFLPRLTGREVLVEWL